MKISRSRLFTSLRSHGFSLYRGFAPGLESFGFVRPDKTGGIYQQIDVGFAGRKSEVVFAYIAISATKWIGIKGLSETRPLLEIDRIAERGWTIIENQLEAKDWENSLVQAAVPAVDKFADENRELLLSRTEMARNKADACLELLGNGDVIELIESFRSRLSKTAILDAERLAGAAGVMQLRDTEDEYFLSCLSVLSVYPNFVGKNPLETPELSWIIQLVADRILSWKHSD